ncbi:hypothetical protein ABH908_000144 [Pseudomonas frederiksbergensis]|uniref:hypothetical protein n=1 Tax=Pseudomonas TaxID=286 RepID=UPI003D1B5C16
MANNMLALEAASGDAHYVLEDEDLAGAPTWVIAAVPIADIPVPVCRETPEDRKIRLSVIRAVPASELWLPILFVDSAGTVELIDGGHRIAVAQERGQFVIDALVRLANRSPDETQATP